MKSGKKYIKAIAVIIIVGIGIISNMTNNLTISKFLYSNNLQNSINKADSIKTEPSRLFIYTKNIINEGIHHLISNL
jgi:hypothetical protein